MNWEVLKFKISKRYYQFFGEKTYASYEAAMKDCSAQGYENDIITQFVKEKALKTRAEENKKNLNHLYNPNLLSVLAIINLLKTTKKSINIIDFGGGDGGLFLHLKACIGDDFPINWYVVETPANVVAMKAFETEHLHFESDLAKLVQSLDSIDLIHTSCTLQYTHDPYFYLKEICHSKAQYIIFNRQILNNTGKDIISIQRSLLSWHGSKESIQNFKDCEVRYPHFNMAIQNFEKIITEKHKILLTYEDYTGFTEFNKRFAYNIGKSYCIVKK